MKFSHCSAVFFRLQSNGDGPKRVPVSHQSQVVQKAVVTPTQHQRVLGVSNGPQRVQRPVSQQKPVSHISVAAKHTPSGDQNVNPATVKQTHAPLPKPESQHNQPKPHVPIGQSVLAKPLSEEKLQSELLTEPDQKMLNVKVFRRVLKYLFAVSDKPAKNSEGSSSKYVKCQIMMPLNVSCNC